MISPAAPGEVLCEVYLAPLQSLRPHHERFLGERDIVRRGQLRSAGDRDRFTLGVALLKAAVAGRAGIEAASVVVSRRCHRCGEWHGRPRIEGLGLETSVSHSGDLVAVAVAGCGVGVDVEEPRDVPFAKLAARVCAPAEQAHVVTADAFYAYWTRKEAVVKATGEGFQRCLKRVVVPPPDVHSAALTLDDLRCTQCVVSDLRLPVPYRGAVAVLTDRQVRVATFDAAAAL